MNSLVLAYIGDSVYEIYIRKYLVESGIAKVNTLQNEAIKYTSARGQSKYLDLLINDNFFNKEEMDIIYRARNHKGGRHPKNTDILTYKHATALEAIIGYLYLNNGSKRIDEIMKIILKGE